MEVAVVGRAVDQDGSFRRYNHQVVAIPGGRFVIIPLHLQRDPPPILSYDVRIVGRLGRRGEGPGEVGALSWLSVLPNGNLELISRVRVNEFTPDGRFVRARTLRTEARGTTGVRVGSHFVTNSIVVANGGDKNPLYVFGPDGNIIRTIARPDGRARGTFRALGPAVSRPTQEYWLTERLGLDPTGFSIRRQDLAGASMLDLRFEPRWFRETSREGGAISPVPRYIRETKDGRIIILVARPRATLDLYLRTKAGHPFDYFETVLLIIDPLSRRVVGSQAVDSYPQGILDDTHIVTSAADDDDVPILTVWRVGPVLPLAR
jgi:hypothetical protein